MSYCSYFNLSSFGCSLMTSKTPLTVALIIVVFIDNTLEVEEAKRDRGMLWWVNFRKFKGDSQNEKFSHSISVNFQPSPPQNMILRICCMIE
jgi:hypothetical protein